MIYWGITFPLLIICFNNSYFWWSIWHFPSFIFQSCSIEQLFILLHRKEKSARVVWTDFFARVHTYRDTTNTEFMESKTVSAEVWVGNGSPLLTGKKFLWQLSCRRLIECGRVRFSLLFSLSVEKIEMYWPGRSKLRSSSWVFSKFLDSFPVVHLDSL